MAICKFPKGLCDTLIKETINELQMCTDYQEIELIRNRLGILHKLKPHADNNDAPACGQIMCENIHKRKLLTQELNESHVVEKLILRVIGVSKVADCPDEAWKQTVDKMLAPLTIKYFNPDMIDAIIDQCGETENITCYLNKSNRKIMADYITTEFNKKGLS